MQSDQRRLAAQDLRKSPQSHRATIGVAAWLIPALVLVVALCAVPRMAAADEWVVFGTQQLGMGGTGVAFANGALSPHWNPANLWHYNRGDKPGLADNSALVEWDIAIEATVSVAIQGNLARHFDSMASALDFIDNEPGSTDAAAIALAGMGTSVGANRTRDVPDSVLAALSVVANVGALNEAWEGAYVAASTGVSVRVDFLGFYTNATVFGGAVADFDITNLALTIIPAFGGLLPGDSLYHALTYENPAPPPEDYGFDSTDPQYYFVPTTQGGIDLSLELQTAFPIATPAEADGMAALFEIASIRAGVDLGDPGVRAGIIILLENSGPGASAIFLAGFDPFTGTNSGVAVKGLGIVESGISLAYQVFSGDLELEAVNFGITIKAMFARAFEDRVLFEEQGTGIQRVLDSLYAEVENLNLSYLQFSFDLGVTFVMLDHRLRISAVAKNLTSPRFPFGARYVFVDPQFRIGVGYDIEPNMFRLAFDIDIVPNNSYVMAGYGSQVVAVGAEFKPISDQIVGVAFRAGFSFNFLPVLQKEFVIHAGFAFRLWVFQFDFGAAFDPRFVNVSQAANAAGTSFALEFGDITDLPARFSASFTLSINASW